MSAYDDVLSKLQGVRPNGKGHIALCPAHDDRKASLSVDHARAGGAVLKCFAGCDTADVVRALGLTMAQLFDATPETAMRADAVAVYEYKRADGSVAYRIKRRADKTFILSPSGVKERIPYHLPEIRQAINAGRTILVVEGEKDADNLTQLGFVATTSPFGAESAKKMPAAFYEPFSGAKRIIVLADNDEPGRRCAHAHAKALVAHCSDVRIIERLPDVQKHGDVSDLIARGYDADRLRSVFEHAVPFVPASTEAADNSMLDVAVVDLRTVAIERIEWLEPGRIPFGELTITEGQGGIGKTTAILDILARASRGAAMPSGTACDPCASLIIATEDSHSTLKARLVAADANLERIHLVNSMADGEMLTLPAHAAAIERAIRKFNARIVYIDSLFSHLDPGLNPDKAADMRRGLAPLSVTAHATRAAVLAMRHWRKSGGDAASRGLGSVDIRNIARSVLTIGAHPQNEGILVCAVSKSNLGKAADALLYRLESADVPTDDGATVSVGRVVWEGTEAIAADDLAATADASEESINRRDAAADFLKNLLADGPLPSSVVYERGKEGGIASGTLKRAAKRLHIVYTEAGFPRRTQWELPSQITSQTTPPIYDLNDPTDPTGEPQSDQNLQSAQLDHIIHSPARVIQLEPCSKLCSICKRLAQCFVRGETFICAECAGKEAA